MMEYIEYIVNPDIDVKAYLHQRWLLKIFIILNLIVELAFICINVYMHPDLLSIVDLHNKKKQSEFVVVVAFTFITTFNIAFLIFGLYSVSKH